MVNSETIIQMIIVAVLVYLVLKNLYGSDTDKDQICNYCHDMNLIQEEVTDVEVPPVEEVIDEEQVTSQPVPINANKGTVEAFSQPMAMNSFSSAFAEY